MDRDELRGLAVRLLSETDALRAAYPDAAAMRELPISELGPEPAWDRPTVPAFRAALRFLRDEMALVRGGRSGGLGVLDDEAANVRRLLLCL